MTMINLNTAEERTFNAYQVIGGVAPPGFVDIESLTPEDWLALVARLRIALQKIDSMGFPALDEGEHNTVVDKALGQRPWQERMKEEMDNAP